VLRISSADAGFPSTVNYLKAMFAPSPSHRCLIVISVVEILDVNVFHSRPNIGEAPRNSLVMPTTRKAFRVGDACYVEAACLKVCFIPEVGHLMTEMHVIDNSGLPVTVCAPETTQLFDPLDGRRIGQYGGGVDDPVERVTALASCLACPRRRCLLHPSRPSILLAKLSRMTVGDGRATASGQRSRPTLRDQLVARPSRRRSCAKAWTNR